MIKLYEGIKKFALKSVLCAGLAAMTLTGCDESDTPKQDQPTLVRHEKGRTYFEDWGFVDKIRHGPSLDTSPLDIELGDIDGDGDLDIIVGTYRGGVRIYENRIPRKE